MKPWRLFWMLSKAAFIGLAILFCIAAFSAASLPESAQETGCYRHADGFFAYKCSGFAGSGAMGFVLTLPYYVLVGPALLNYEISTGGIVDQAIRHPMGVAWSVGSSLWIGLGLLWPFRWLYGRTMKHQRATEKTSSKVRRT